MSCKLRKVWVFSFNFTFVNFFGKCITHFILSSRNFLALFDKARKNTIRSCDCMLLNCDVHFIWIISAFSIKMSEHNPKNRLTGAGLSLLSLIKKVMAKTTRADLTIVIGVHVCPDLLPDILTVIVLLPVQ